MLQLEWFGNTGYLRRFGVFEYRAAVKPVECHIVGDTGYNGAAEVFITVYDSTEDAYLSDLIHAIVFWSGETPDCSACRSTKHVARYDGIIEKCSDCAGSGKDVVAEGKRIATMLVHQHIEENYAEQENRD